MGTISDKRNKKNGTTEKKDNSPKGFGAYSKNLGKMLFHLFVWSIISFGFIISIKQKGFTQFSIPEFLKDFSKKEGFSIKKMMKHKTELNGFEKWSSTIYYKLIESENNILHTMNGHLQTIFGLSYIHIHNNSDISNYIFSTLSALFLFILSPFLIIVYSMITSTIAFFKPIISSFVNRDVLNYASIINLIIVLCLLWVFFISGIFTSPIVFLIILLFLSFGPYIVKIADILKNILQTQINHKESILKENMTLLKQVSSTKDVKKIEPIKDTISGLKNTLSTLNELIMPLNRLVGAEKITYFKEYGLPVFKKVIPFLINFLLIYAAATTTTYGLPEGVSIGMWIGLAIFNIGAIMMVFKSL